MEGSAAIPWLIGETPAFSGPFRVDIEHFVAQHGTEAAVAGHSSKCWTVALQSPQGQTLLYVYREELGDDPTVAVCDSCRIIGEPWPPILLALSFNRPCKRSGGTTWLLQFAQPLGLQRNFSFTSSHTSALVRQAGSTTQSAGRAITSPYRQTPRLRHSCRRRSPPNRRQRLTLAPPTSRQPHPLIPPRICCTACCTSTAMATSCV